MSQRNFAKDQSAGFTNRIERVAIVGAGGQVGSHLAKALIKTGKHVVTAISREGSTNQIPDGVKVARVNYDEEASLVNALRGQQALLISLAPSAPAGTQERLIAAASKAGVPWILPNSWGIDFTNESLGNGTKLGPGIVSAIKTVEDGEASSWIAVVCGVWYEYSLSMGPWFLGFDFHNRRVELYDDGKTPINVSTWEQCGEAVARLLSLKELPDDEDDTSPSVSAWRNKPLYMSSFQLTQRDMLDSAHRVLGTTDADWEIEYEPAEERYERGMEILQGGNRMGFGMSLYARCFFPSDSANHQANHELANSVLGLGQEDLDDATRKGIEMANEKFGALGNYGETNRIGQKKE